MWTAAAIGAAVTGAVVADQVSKANDRSKTKARLRDEVASKPSDAVCISHFHGPIKKNGIGSPAVAG